MKDSFAGAAMLLRNSRASGSVVDSCVAFERFWPWKFASGLRPWSARRLVLSGGSWGGWSFGLKLLCDAHASSRVPSTEKWSLET